MLDRVTEFTGFLTLSRVVTQMSRVTRVSWGAAMGVELDVWRSWPSAPEDERPKALYVAESLPAIVSDWLASERGWRVVDVRALPNRSDADRAEGVKAYLEGVRVGSIEPVKELLRYVELEARICGLLSNKQRADDMVPTVEGETLENILEFGKGKRQRAQ